MAVVYKCDKCKKEEEFFLNDVQFYSDYMFTPDYADFEETTIKWHDNVLYPASGEPDDWKEGDYELLCDECYNGLKDGNGKLF